jgi:protein-disulfide isomerase
MKIRSVKSVVNTISTVLVVLVAGVVLWKTLREPSNRQPPARPAVEDVRELTIDVDRLEHVRGQGDVVLVEFADYECPFCARHARDTAPAIKQLIDAGKLRHAFFNFPLTMHSNAQKAAEAAECAAKQGRFWEMHEQLFADAAALTTPGLVRSAERISLDVSAFTECMDQGKSSGVVKTQVELGRQLGVSATPAFFVGRRSRDGSISLVKRINGALPFERFDEVINDVSDHQRASR